MHESGHTKQSAPPMLPSPRSAWMEVADHRGPMDEWSAEFELMFVVLTNERSLDRKINEAFLALWL